MARKRISGRHSKTKRQLDPKDPEAQADKILEDANRWAESKLRSPHSYALLNNAMRQKQDFEEIARSIVALGEPNDHVTGVVVTGPGSTGKSWHVNQVCIPALLKSYPKTHIERIPDGKVLDLDYLAQTMWKCRKRGNVIVMDDVNGIWSNVPIMSLLKGVLGDGRVLSGVKIKGEDNDEIIDGEKCHCKITLVSNDNLNQMFLTHPRKGEHIKAVADRMEVYELVYTQIEMFAPVKRFVKEEGLLDSIGISEEQINAIYRLWSRDLNKWSIGLRQMARLAQTVKERPNEWIQYAYSRFYHKPFISKKDRVA